MNRLDSGSPGDAGTDEHRQHQHDQQAAAVGDHGGQGERLDQQAQRKGFGEVHHQAALAVVARVAMTATRAARTMGVATQPMERFMSEQPDEIDIISGRGMASLFLTAQMLRRLQIKGLLSAEDAREIISEALLNLENIQAGQAPSPDLDHARLLLERYLDSYQPKR
ncbi:hypothetical protein [Azospirillum palustre]